MSEPAYAVDIGAQKRLGKLTGQTQDRPVYLVQNNHRLFGQLLTTNFANGAYGWQQVSPIGGGQWIKTPNGLFGTTIQNPAYEKTLNPSVPLGSIVDLEVGALSKSNPPGQDYRFAYCCGGSCAGSGSGSGSGGGGGNIITACCPAGLPQVLHLGLSNCRSSCVVPANCFGGACAPFQAISCPPNVQLTWDGAYWSGFYFLGECHFNPLPPFNLIHCHNGIRVEFFLQCTSGFAHNGSTNAGNACQADAADSECHTAQLANNGNNFVLWIVTTISPVCGQDAPFVQLGAVHCHPDGSFSPSPPVIAYERWCGKNLQCSPFSVDFGTDTVISGTCTLSEVVSLISGLPAFDDAGCAASGYAHVTVML